MVLSLVLKVLAVTAGFVSAGCWLYSAKTISREEEIERRRRKAKPGETVSLGGVEVGDGDKMYELPATLRHQGVLEPKRCDLRCRGYPAPSCRYGIGSLGDGPLRRPFR